MTKRKMFPLRVFGRVIVLLAAASGGCWCDAPSTIGAGPTTRRVSAGSGRTFDCTAFDKAARRVVSGTLDFDGSLVDGDVTGRWHLTRLIPPACGEGGEIMTPGGDGRFVGNIKDGAINLNLQPNVADANFVLDGKIDGDGIGGDWLFCSEAGVNVLGRFEARRR